MAELESRFEAARRSCGGDDLHLEIAEQTLVMRFAGSAIRAALAPPFEHLSAAEPTEGGSLRIDVWDGESSGVAPPRLPWAPGDVRDLGEVHGGFNEGTIRTVCDPTYGAITVVDQARGKALFQVPGASTVPWYERASPMRAALHHLLAPAATLVHAGAVGSQSGGVLVAGRSGVGKSTLTAAAAVHGMSFAGDDYVALTLNGAATAHSVHATAKLSGSSVEMLPELGLSPMRVQREPDEKTVVNFHRELPGSIRRSLPISAIVAPRLEPGAAAWRRVSSMEGLRALAPSTLLQLPSDSGGGLGPMATLARSVPSYDLTLGDDLRAAVGALEEVLRDAG